MSKQVLIGLQDLGLAKNKVLLNKHPKRKNNEKVAAMYSAYQDGMSLEAIGELYRKSRQAIYDVFRSRGYQLRSKQFKGLVILDGIKFAETKGGYLRGTVAGKRMLIHQYIWSKHHGPIPEAHVLFHIDGNPKNNAIENLELIAKSAMQKKFNPNGNNQFTKHDHQSSI